MKNLIAKATVAMIVASAATYAVASAADAPAATAVAARKANFKEMGGAFKTINDEIKSGAPDLNTVKPLARDLAARSAQVGKLFPRGSGPESGVKTRAKAEIWSDQAEFLKLQAALTSAADTLNAAASRGDMAALASARTAVGASCKSCHDRFRQPD